MRSGASASIVLATLFAAIEAHGATPSIRAGGAHTIALHADGSVRTWGDDHSGALGVSRQTYFPSPVAVQDLAGIRKLSAGANHVVALLERGKAWSTKELAAKLEVWMQLGAPVAFLVGGPDGLSPACVARANERWSLSNLTLPHGLVRVVVAEALYRAWSLLENHPYHRA